MLLQQLSSAQEEVENLLSKSKEEKKHLQQVENERDALLNDKENVEGQLTAVNLVSFESSSLPWMVVIHMSGFDTHQQLRETRAQLSHVTEARDSMDAEVRGNSFSFHTRSNENLS